MVCINEFQLSPAVVLYNRMQLIRKGFHISFHDLDPYDISEMMNLIVNMMDKKPDLGFYSLVLGVLDTSMGISQRYYSYELNMAKSARRQVFYKWQSNSAIVLDHYQRLTISLPEHRNPYRALQVAYMVAYRSVLQT